MVLKAQPASLPDPRITTRALWFVHLVNTAVRSLPTFNRGEKANTDFFRDLVRHHVNAILDHFQIHGGAVNFRDLYRGVLVPQGGKFAREWGIPPVYKLMGGDGAYYRFWGAVFDGWPNAPN